jgi:hypothetical protein
METAPRIALALAAATAVLTASANAAAGGYGWPVKSFDRQHPVRAYFGDPRVGADGRGGVSRTIHFGIDVSAPNGTAVYAVSSGTISRHPLHPDDVVLVQSAGVTFEYWHVVPAVSHGYAVAGKTVLGWIEKPWAHVHFAERLGSTYVNPLRPGALTPYRDATRPTIRRLEIRPDGSGVDLVADAFDMTPVAVPAPWAGKPVAPALVEWRVRRPGVPAPAWTVAIDFRTFLPRIPFAAVYADGTRQNYASTLGSYRFVLARGWHATPQSVLEVRVSDTAGNTATEARTF